MDRWEKQLRWKGRGEDDVTSVETGTRKKDGKSQARAASGDAEWKVKYDTKKF